MAISVSEIEGRLKQKQHELERRIHEAKISLDKYGELPQLKYQREMLELEKYKRARQGEFGLASVKQEGSNVWYDDLHQKLDSSFKMTTAQRWALERKKQADEELRAKAETERRRNLLEAPHNACALSVAINLWIVKFGDGWVRVNDLPNGNVGHGEIDWTRMLARLGDANKIEKLEDYVRIIT